MFVSNADMAEGKRCSGGVTPALRGETIIVTIGG